MVVFQPPTSPHIWKHLVPVAPVECQVPLASAPPGHLSFHALELQHPQFPCRSVESRQGLFPSSLVTKVSKGRRAKNKEAGWKGQMKQQNQLFPVSNLFPTVSNHLPCPFCLPLPRHLSASRTASNCGIFTSSSPCRSAMRIRNRLASSCCFCTWGRGLLELRKWWYMTVWQMSQQPIKIGDWWWLRLQELATFLFSPWMYFEIPCVWHVFTMASPAPNVYQSWFLQHIARSSRHVEDPDCWHQTPQRSATWHPPTEAQRLSSIRRVIGSVVDSESQIRTTPFP